MALHLITIHNESYIIFNTFLRFSLILRTILYRIISNLGRIESMAAPYSGFSVKKPLTSLHRQKRLSQ